MVDMRFSALANFYNPPISLDLIENNLYLGNITAARDVYTLSKYKITHVVTVDMAPLPSDIQNKLDLITLNIPVMDLPSEDLLLHFENIYKFIIDGIQKGSVLVHCYFGISRSATVVIAYLMKKYHYSFNKAFETVKEKRSMINPNSGFVWQLQLYHDMNCNMDRNHMQYKIFRLKGAAEKIKESGVFPLEFSDMIKPDPEIVARERGVRGYRCKLCKRLLAGESNRITHKNPDSVNLACTEILSVEPLAWMEAVTKMSEGTLNCPKCYHKVGIFNWVTNYQCPCGFVGTPIFLILDSSVYWSTN